MTLRNSVTIIIPTYNGSKYICSSLESVLSQKCSWDVEILIIDDCSTDQTLNKVKNIISSMRHNFKINIVQNKRNLGLANNWNKGIKLTNTNWFKFHFQDDLMESGCMQKMIEYQEKSRVNFVICSRNYISDDINIANKYNELPSLSNLVTSSQLITKASFRTIIKNNYLKNNFIGEPICGLYNKDFCVNQIGLFDTDLRQVIDFEYFIRIMTNTDTFFINERLVHFRLHFQSQSHKNSKLFSIIPYVDRLIINKKIQTEPFYKNLKKIIDYDYYKSFEMQLLNKCFKRIYINKSDRNLLLKYDINVYSYIVSNVKSKTRALIKKLKSMYFSTS